MSPRFHFQLTREGYEKCIALLAAAGMTFTEERRDSFASPPIHDIHGKLATPHGVVPCVLRDCQDTSFDFMVLILEHQHIDILEDVPKALAGYLIPRKRSAV